MAAVHAVVLAIMINIANFGRIGINATALVLHHRVVGPAVFPPAITEIAVLSGHLVALIVGRQITQPEIARRALRKRRHDVLGHAPLGEVIECREQPREAEGVTLHDRTGQPEAQVLGRGRHGRH